MSRYLILGMSFVFALLLVVRSHAQIQTLPKLKIDRSTITVSGISSGAFMAVQLGVIFSGEIKGVASVAGGPFGCAGGDTQTAIGVCMGNPSRIQLETLVAGAKALERASLIDSLENLKQQKFYIFAGTEDKTVLPESGRKLVEFYQQLSVRPEQISFEKEVPAAHGFPTMDRGNDCATGAHAPWILNCHYDGALEIFQALLGQKLLPQTQAKSENLIAFDQKEFGDRTTPLSDFGWIYVPTECKDGKEKCHLHIALHGCRMTPQHIQDQFVQMAGYNEWAESNRIVVLYPQSAVLGPDNPNGCWDWYGYTGKNYLSRYGKQIRAIWAMVARVSQGK